MKSKFQNFKNTNSKKLEIQIIASWAGSKFCKNQIFLKWVGVKLCKGNNFEYLSA